MRLAPVGLSIVGVAAILACVLSSGAVVARTWHVPGDAPNIQAGINMAVGGDTVRVGEGTYSGEGNRDIRFDRNIVLMSDGGPERTIISCGGSESDEHRGFLCLNGSTGGTIDGFTVIGGHVGDGGAAIRFIFGSVFVTNCALRDNEGGTQGGAIFVYVRTSPTIDHCTITGNTADAGPAVLCLANSAPTISDCLIVNNHARYETGGISCRGASPTISRCVIAGNVGPQSGGIMSRNHSNLTVNDCLITGNRAQSGEGQ